MAIDQSSASTTGAEYRAAFDGRFSGILTWPEFDSLWTQLRAAPVGWYVFQLSEAPPAEPVTAAGFGQALAAAAAMLAPARDRTWCGAVYVDDRGKPTFVKVYDPFGMAACGGGATLPHVVFSRIRPTPLQNAVPDRRGLLARLSGRG